VLDQDIAAVIDEDPVDVRLPCGGREVVMNTMWALDDFTEANGATRVVPGIWTRRRGWR